MDKYNKKWVMRFAKKGSPNWALTIGQTAYYSCPESEVTSRWRKHEDFHKVQWRRGWYVGFLVMYLWYLIRYGYDKHPYEIEAWQQANTP